VTGGIREYGRHRGVSHTAVRKAINDGRIRINHGIIDFEAADAEWAKNTVGSTVVAGRKIQPAPESRETIWRDGPPEPDPATIDRASFVTHRTRKEKAEADLAELKARKAIGESLDASDVRKAFTEIGRIHSAAREAIPAQLATRLVGKSDLAEIVPILRAALRACDERVASEIESRHGEMVFEQHGEEGAPDGDSLGGN